MLQDKIIFGGLIGILSNVSMDIVELPIWKLKIIDHPMHHYIASIFLDVQTLHQTFLGLVISFLADYIYSAFLGIIFIYFIYLTGKHFSIIKGLIFGLFLWFFSFGGLRSLEIVKLQELAPVDAMYQVLFHLVFGITLGILVKRYGEPALK